MTSIEEFKKQRKEEIANQARDSELRHLSSEWIAKAFKHNYSYHFDWLGLPIIQHPQDIIAMQQLIWKVQPDLIIETGVARGGSAIFYASLLELIAQCGGNTAAAVLSIDIDIRSHNKKAIFDHPLSKRIRLIEGSSVDTGLFDHVSDIANRAEKVMVCLDSNHTHDHVLKELKLYSKLVSVGSYCVVFDTIIEDFPVELSQNRAWGKGNNPKTAVWKFLDWIKSENLRNKTEAGLNFVIDQELEASLLVTVAPDGYLKRI